MRIETERLVLRLPTLDDADVIGELVGDAEVVRFLGGVIVSPDEHEAIVERWLQRWEEHGVGPFMVERREDGRFVGRTGLLVWDVRDWSHTGIPDPEFAQPEIGWAFARAAWGNGYATEAARAVLEWARHQKSCVGDRTREHPLATRRRTSRRDAVGDRAVAEHRRRCGLALPGLSGDRIVQARQFA